MAQAGGDSIAAGPVRVIVYGVAFCGFQSTSRNRNDVAATSLQGVHRKLCRADCSSACVLDFVARSKSRTTFSDFDTRRGGSRSFCLGHV